MSDLLNDPEKALLVLLPTLFGSYFLLRIFWIFGQALRAQDPYEFHQKDFSGKMLTSAVCASALIVPLLVLGLPDSVLFWTVFVAVLFFGLCYAWQASQRNKPRVCAECGAKMRKIEDAIEERRHLNVRQAWEEFMHVKDYDVWICPAGHIRKDAYKLRLRV